ncbi:MAG: metal-dependent transcriptional regulator [Planctomycetota bacterium]|nr:metal-dependent transcriptional regulator [Planctomycetota bacterium]
MGSFTTPQTATVCGIVLSLLFWPRWGLLALWRRFRELAHRELAEHTLKHIHHCQYLGMTASLESVAGAVGVSRSRAAGLLERLECLGLVSSSDGRIKLTPEGRSDAIRVIRIHRLWEKYFADYTSLDETLWHDEADRREHTTSDAEMERLAEQLGYPRFDPHGAPIPTISGELPGLRGVPLAGLEPYEQAAIVHVEDEPAEVYAQLAAQGLTVGAVVRLIDANPARIRLDVAGTQQVIAPVVAANVSVERIAKPAIDLQNYPHLTQLARGEKARVIGILPTCRGLQRHRLLDLGIVPGTRIETEIESAGRDPVAYRIRGALIALRNSQTDQIQVETIAGVN